MGAELGAWALALASFTFLWLLTKRDKFPLSWVVKTVLAVFGGFGIAATSFGTWVAGRIGRFGDLVGSIPSWFGFPVVIPGVVLTSIATVALVFVALYGLRDKSADRPELIAWIMVPLMALAAAGPIADAVTNDISPAVREAGNGSINRLIGG